MRSVLFTQFQVIADERGIARAIYALDHVGMLWCAAGNEEMDWERLDMPQSNPQHKDAFHVLLAEQEKLREANEKNEKLKKRIDELEERQAEQYVPSKDDD